jgi:hypothetical protein
VRFPRCGRTAARRRAAFLVVIKKRAGDDREQTIANRRSRRDVDGPTLFGF